MKSSAVPRPIEAMSLEGLLEPLSTSSFLENHWEQFPLHLSRNSEDFYPAELRNLPVEDIIWRNCADWGEVRLGGPMIGTVGEDHASRPPNLASLRKALHQGCTVVINDLQRKDRHAALLCRAIERDLCCRANVNLYVTAPGQAGLAMHYDDEDVFVLQTSGTKHWRVLPGPAPLPARDSPYRDDDSRDGEAQAYFMTAGDLLYIPRGVRHTAFTEDRASRHLTVSIHTVTWLDVLTGMIANSADADLALRRSVPAAMLRNPSPVPPDIVVRSLDRTGRDPEAWSSSLRAAGDGLLSGMENLCEAGLDAIDSAGDIANGRFRVAPDQLFFLDDGPEIRLRATAGTFEFPAAAAPLVEHICAGDSFTLGDLPGRGSVASKCLIVRRLLDEGFLIRETGTV